MNTDVLPAHSEVVVIGGGVMGAAALHYLVELGCERPVLIERDTLASGSTGHCAGGVRTLFSDALNRSIGEESIRRLERFADDGAKLITPEDARAIVPQLDVGGLVAAALDERAGYVTPDLVVQGYA